MKAFLNIIVSLALLSGCQPFQNIQLPAIPTNEVISEKINKDLEISHKYFNNTFKIGDNITFEVHLITDIKVDSNFDIKTYFLDENNTKWVAVENLNKPLSFITSVPHNSVILSRSNPITAVTVHPEIDNQTETNLLVIITGAVIDNEPKNEFVTSYIIVTLAP